MFIGALNMGTALANPDGAPWGAAEPGAAQNCASCHFDQEPMNDSGYITFAGLGGGIEAARTYNLVLTFAKAKDATAGFMIMSSAGVFISADDPDIEVNQKQVRSRSVKRNGNRAMWWVQWRAPDETNDEIIFYIAVNESNDDQSSLGDQIHFKTVTVSADAS